MKLCIAEKPSVAKEIARILGANSRKDGYFEGNGYCISWTFGHLCTLKAPEDYSNDWKGWRIEFLPMIPPRFGIKVMENDGVQKQFNTIAHLVTQCDEVINCGDAGIEGELIQRWVLSKANCDKPLKRLWISSLTDEAIKEGFEKLKDGKDFDLLYAAGNARAICDWLLGMNASRLYTLKYASGKGVLSIGRVQTPTLALIVKRHEEIQNFIPQTYWEIKTVYRDVTFNSTKGKYEVKEEASAVLEKIKESDFEITEFSQKKGSEHPLKLFDLTALQVECNKKFGFTADDTLTHIQKLYERKLVTYPRVDTTYLPDNMHSKIEGILTKLTPYKNFVDPLLGKPIRKSKKVFDDKKITDHHAIIPTGISPEGLTLYEKQVYDTITRRFIAAFYPDCIVSNTTVMGLAQDIEFKATGKVILEEGWRVLYPKKEIENEGDETQIMPAFEKGERGSHFPDFQEKQTQPPKMHTEATLLRAMETAGKQVDDEELRELMKDNGIGRPSTRANIIETLFKRKYVTRSAKNLVPTITGIQLIHTINNELLKSVELTGIWERKIRQIEKGEYDAKQFLDETKQMVSDLVFEVKNEQYKVISIEESPKVEAKSSKKDDSSESKPKEKTKNKEKAISFESETFTCPKCKVGTIKKGKSAFGCSEYGKSCNFKIDFQFQGNNLSEKHIIALLQKGKTTKIKDILLNNIKQSGIIKFDKEFNLSFEPEVLKKSSSTETNTAKSSSSTISPQVIICPKCNKGEMKKGKTAYGCSRYNEDCKFLIPFDKLKSQFNTEELTQEIAGKIL